MGIDNLRGTGKYGSGSKGRKTGKAPPTVKDLRVTKNRPLYAKTTNMMKPEKMLDL